MVEKRKKIKLLEINKRKKVKGKSSRRLKLENKTSINDTMQKFFLDHNGKMMKKDTYPLRMESLPGLFRKPFKAKVNVPAKVEKPEHSNLLYKVKGTTKYFSSKEKLPEEFKVHATDYPERTIGKH